MGNQTLLEKQKTTILKNIRESVEKHVNLFFNAPDVSEEGIAKYAYIYKDVVPVLDRVFNGNLTIQDIAKERGITSGRVHTLKTWEISKLAWRIYKSTKKVDLRKGRDQIFPLPKDFCLNDLDRFLYDFMPKKEVDKIVDLNKELSELLFNLRSVSLLELTSALIKNKINLFKVPRSALEEFYKYLATSYSARKLNNVEKVISNIRIVMDDIECANIRWGCSDEKWGEICRYVQNNPDTWCLNDIPLSITVNRFLRYCIDAKKTLDTTVVFRHSYSPFKLKVGEMSVVELKKRLRLEVDGITEEDPAPWNHAYTAMQFFKSTILVIEELESDIADFHNT